LARGRFVECTGSTPPRERRRAVKALSAHNIRDEARKSGNSRPQRLLTGSPLAPCGSSIVVVQDRTVNRIRPRLANRTRRQAVRPGPGSAKTPRDNGRSGVEKCRQRGKSSLINATPKAQRRALRRALSKPRLYRTASSTGTGLRPDGREKIPEVKGNSDCLATSRRDARARIRMARPGRWHEKRE